MKIALGCDHGGFELKEKIKAHLIEKGYETEDFGCYSKDSVHYPEFGAKAAHAVQSGECERGIVACTTGIGISISANKVRGVRCALCSDSWSAEMTRRHNDANILALGGRTTDPDLAIKIVDAWLGETFLGQHHTRRIEMLDEM